MGGPWTYADDGRDTDGMRGADREYYESLTEGLGCGIVGRNMYDAADAWGGTKPFPLDDCAVRQRSERGDVHDDAFWLVLDDCLRRWSFSGYAAARRRDDFPAAITVRTPRATVATLRAGYEPVLHSSAERS
jgi:hypothetical protein